MATDTAFEMATASIRFGPGVTREVGMDLADMGARRVMVVTDPNVAKLPPVAAALESLAAERVECELFDRAHVEPTDGSLEEAITFAQEGGFEAFVAVGGGSAIDTAKAANLYSSYPADFLEYVNMPIGRGQPVPGPLKPLIAVPTTAGTGSETTGVVIFDRTEIHTKTGIAHRRLKPTLGLIDPENTRTMPPLVAASTGLDMFCHALESYTAVPYHERPAAERPLLRPAYQGSNPISDVWSAEAVRLGAQYLPRAVEDPEDEEARGGMLLAAAYAGIGFGNAGVHVPHGMSYPVSGMARDYRPPGYVTDKPLVPHGIAVALNAPAVFRFTGQACPERHLRAAELMGADVSGADPADAGAILADCVTGFMKRLGIPNGLSAVGYTSEDIPALVEGAFPQRRVMNVSPRPVSRDDLAALFEDALVAW